MRSYNDDLIMAFAIGCWVKDTAFAESRRDTQYKKAILNSMKKSDSIMNTAIPGMHGYRQPSNEERAKTEVEKNKDFMWLLKG